MIKDALRMLWACFTHALSIFEGFFRYLATSLLLADNNDMVRMIVNSVKTDMASGNEACDSSHLKRNFQSNFQERSFK